LSTLLSSLSFFSLWLAWCSMGIRCFPKGITCLCSRFDLHSGCSVVIVCSLHCSRSLIHQSLDGNLPRPSLLCELIPYFWVCFWTFSPSVILVLCAGLAFVVLAVVFFSAFWCSCLAASASLSPLTRMILAARGLIPCRWTSRRSDCCLICSVSRLLVVRTVCQTEAARDQPHP
jgi:hypothetical protein